MSNRRQFVHQTAAVMMAFGAIASLLQGFAAAQDLSTLTARKIIPLSGEWQFATGSMNSRPSNFDKTVTVPGFHPGGEALWYRRLVTIEGSLPEVVRLEVKKASWGVKVWVNGSEAGESWSIRTASFIDISKCLKGNGFENEIILRVCGSKDLLPPEIPWFISIIFIEEPNFKVHRKNGLYDAVNLILCDAPYVVRAQAVPNVQDDSVKLAVTLRNISSATKSAILKVKIVEDKSGETVAKAEKAHQAHVGESNSEIDISIPDAKLWRPETPHLYRFEVEVHSKGRHTDTYADRFGMRSFSICQNTGRGLLNGRPILLTGVGMFSMWDAAVHYGSALYDDSRIRHAFRFVKTLRGNAVRFSFDLMPDIWYRIADEEGFLMQNEAHWNINDTATLEAVTAEFADWIHEHANHPSVIIWDAANETVKKGPLLREAVKAVRHLDLSNRPWEPSTWFHHTQEAAVLSQKGDVTEWHPYSVFDYLGDGRWKFLFNEGIYPEIFEKGPNPKPVHPGWIVNEYCGLFLNRDGSFYLGQSKRFADAYFAEANGSHYLFGRARFVAWEAEYYRRLPGCLGVLWNSYLWGPGIQQPLASQTLSERELALGRYIADASAPVGVMVNSWQTKIPTGRLKVPVSVANDGPSPWSGTVRLSLIRAGENLSKMGALFEPPQGQAEIDQRIVRQWHETLHEVPVSQQGEAVFDVIIPEAGNYHFVAEITGLDGQPVRSWRDFVSTGDPVDALNETPKEMWVAFAGAGNKWPQFRGPGGSGIAQDLKSSRVPTQWDTTKNVAWRIDVPGLGWSSPIVWGNRVFLTTAVDAQGTEQPEGGFYLGKDRGGRGEHRWLVLAYDLNTGVKLWERQVHQAVPPRTHLKSSYASATPVTDGERVYAWFGEFGLLVALNATDGATMWSFSEKARKSRNNWGFGASPVMHGGRVYLVHDNEEDAYVAAFDASTGKEIWRAKRPPETNWSTPLVWKNDQGTELVVAATGGITSYGLNGEPLWQLSGMSRITVPNPVAGNGMVYVGSGFVADRQKPLYAIRPGAVGDISLKDGQTKNRYVAWLQQRAAPYVPSFLVAGKYLYVIQDNGQLSCYDAVSGTLVYQERLRGHFTASPWMCGDKLFFLNESGDTYVVQSGPTFRLLGVCPSNACMCFK